MYQIIDATDREVIFEIKNLDEVESLFDELVVDLPTLYIQYGRKEMRAFKPQPAPVKQVIIEPARLPYWIPGMVDPTDHRRIETRAYWMNRRRFSADDYALRGALEEAGVA